MSRSLHLFRPPSPRTIHALSGVRPKGFTERDRLFYAFQMAMNTLDTVLSASRPQADGRVMVAFDPEVYRSLKAYVDECKTGQFL
jgi:hypothetical protein